MSRGNKWVPIDQYLAQDLKLIKGSFSRIEAMYAYTLDQDKGIKGTIAGYAMQWSWSRNKVRHFIDCIRTDRGHIRDRKRTHEGHPIHFIDKALMGKKDRSRTDQGQIEDRLHDTTIQPNPNPNPKKKDIPPLPPKPKKQPKLNFKEYLQEKIIENNFYESKDKIFEFYQYRMDMPKAKRYQTEKGINGLFRDLNGCRDSGMIVSECLEIAMEKGWMTPGPGYFKNNNKKNGFSNVSEQNTQTCKDWINE